MESLWKKTEEVILEDKEELKKQCTADVCIIGGRDNRNKHSLFIK